MTAPRLPLVANLRLPLAVNTGPLDGGRGIDDAAGRQVAFVACHARSLATTTDDARAIAAAIVRAVNTHAQLLDALRLIERHALQGSHDRTYAKDQCDLIAEAARAAIAAAEAPR